MAGTSDKRSRSWINIGLRYLLFQVPGYVLLMVSLLLIQQWKDLSPWIVWCLVALWVAKDVILFPFIWRSFDRENVKGKQSMTSMHGIAVERLVPSGYIRVRGELWRAEVIGGGWPIEKGETVRVEGVRGLSLLVVPEGEKRT